MSAKFLWFVNMTPLYTPTKFHQNSFKTSHAVVFTDRMTPCTHARTQRLPEKTHPLLSGGTHYGVTSARWFDIKWHHIL